MVASMTNMQNFLGFRLRKYQFGVLLLALLTCRIFWVFRLKKTSVWYYYFNEKYAERVNIHVDMCMLICMTNLQNFRGF